VLDQSLKIRHSKDMNSATACEDVASMNHKEGVSLIMKPDGRAGEALDHALRAAGFCVRVAPTVFDIVTEAQRAGGALRHIFVGVDHWGPSEFRLLPLVRREWPATTIVACYSPGFEYKGRVAELVGADAVLSGTDAMVQFVESLAASAEPATPYAPEPPEPPPDARAEAPRPVEAPPIAAAPASPASDFAAPEPPAAEASAAEPPPPAPDVARPPASPLQSIPRIQRQAPAPQPAPAPPAGVAADQHDVLL
jgi:hypothetical protein